MRNHLGARRATRAGGVSRAKTRQLLGFGFSILAFAVAADLVRRKVATPKHKITSSSSLSFSLSS